LRHNSAVRGTLQKTKTSMICGDFVAAAINLNEINFLQMVP
jgi:hypothetical protein